ncbi:MAG: hypothetical protein CSA72_07375 [Rhodobacterales bacterium]|nr:MAG: hypothetical protein CSA72_07375 [Rhodobacterales bacterium]
MWRLIKLLLGLAVLAAAGLVAYAYLGPVFMPGDFEPHQSETRIPVMIDLGE